MLGVTQVTRVLLLSDAWSAVRANLRFQKGGSLPKWSRNVYDFEGFNGWGRPLLSAAGCVSSIVCNSHKLRVLVLEETS